MVFAMRHQQPESSLKAPLLVSDPVVLYNSMKINGTAVLTPKQLFGVYFHLILKFVATKFWFPE